MSAISIKDLKFSYGDTFVLNGINMTLEKGKFYCIIGPNGSGKTTLLKNLQKILKQNKDSIYIQGKDLTAISIKELSKQMATVPQETRMDFDFTVLDMVLMGRSPYIKRFESESKYDLELSQKAMEATNTWKFKNKSVREISGGELQRAIVSRAMVQDTDILLLDEPVSNLDLYHQIAILKTVSGFCRSKGVTVVAVLHDLNLAIEFSDILILLDQGEIVTMGRPEEVITEDNIKTLYDMKCIIIENPVSGKPHIIPTDIHT